MADTAHDTCLSVVLEGVDDEQMSEAEIDAEFERTQPIGNAVNALVRAEGIIARALGDDRR